MAPSVALLNPSGPYPNVQPPKPTVYLLDTFSPEAIEEARSLFDIVLPCDTRHKDWHQAKYLLIRSSTLTREDIEQCPNLLAIGKQGVGVDKIDAAACQERGIKILNTPGVNARAVAELVLALTMSLAREIRSISLRMASGEVIRKEACSGLILHQSTIGILGMGNIGRTVAKMFQGAFDSRVVAYDPYMSGDAWSDIPHVRANTVREVSEIADVITIHVPLTSETKDLISYKEMKTMKRTALLINTSRGGIVNETDLAIALDEQLIWGAGLDCHVQEPPTLETYKGLWKHRNVISLPHIGAATRQTQIETACAAVRKLSEHASLAQA